jgi:tRNA (guanine-N7-)-methyltransferase
MTPDQNAADGCPHHRPIRSFVLREGRLTAGQKRAFATLWPRFGVDWQPGMPIDLPALFGNTRPVTLEIGFGNGESLASMAEQAPEANWLGVEVHRPGVGHLLLELERRRLTNVRIVRHDAVELIKLGLLPASLARVLLFFPDPWPKVRHQKRRILTRELVAHLTRVIAAGGIFHAATDWTPYAEQMLAALSACEWLENTAGPGRYAPRPGERPLTRFERRGERLGHTVHDIIFRRR